MSQPKRYSLVASYYCSDAKMEAFEDGEFVRHADYAALQAENERLESNTTKLCTHGDLEIARLQAENERLRSVNDDNKSETEATRIRVAALQAENERLNERLMYLEATRPRDPHHGGKVYLMSFHESNEKLPVNPGRLFSEMNCIDEIASLKAEVERLNVNNIGCESSIKLLRYDISKLQAENERLRKAGDAMAFQIKYESQLEDEAWGVDTGTPERVQAWLAAKGVQS